MSAEDHEGAGKIDGWVFADKNKLRTICSIFFGVKGHKIGITCKT